MQRDADPSRTPQDLPHTHDDTGEPLEHDDGSTTPPTHTKQTGMDEHEKRKHDESENELPSSQEKNPVPPGSTQR